METGARAGGSKGRRRLTFVDQLKKDSTQQETTELRTLIRRGAFFFFSLDILSLNWYLEQSAVQETWTKRKTNESGLFGEQKCLQEAFKYRQRDHLSQTMVKTCPFQMDQLVMFAEIISIYWRKLLLCSFFSWKAGEIIRASFAHPR